MTSFVAREQRILITGSCSKAHRFLFQQLKPGVGQSNKSQYQCRIGAIASARRRCRDGLGFSSKASGNRTTH
eukprot:2596543-Amphidinium_carterae.1